MEFANKITGKFAFYWKILLETIFIKMCIGCGAEGNFLCIACLAKIPRQIKQVCPICYAVSPIGAVCDLCKTHRQGLANAAQKSDYFLDGLIAACEFKEKSLLQKSVHVFKYEFVQSLADQLGELLIETVKKYYFTKAIVCAVPLHKARYRWRGFNQSQLLADRMSKQIGIRSENLLNRKSYNKPQMELKREERLKNVADAFEGATPPFAWSCNRGAGLARDASLANVGAGAPPPETVLLVDDIATTTATLNACAKALKQAGVKKVFAIVLARVY